MVATGKPPHGTLPPLFGASLSSGACRAGAPGAVDPHREHVLTGQTNPASQRPCHDARSVSCHYARVSDVPTLHSTVLRPVG
jgi:hypothetical protein